MQEYNDEHDINRFNDRDGNGFDYGGPSKGAGGFFGGGGGCM